MPSGLHNWSKTDASNNSADSAINWAEGQAPSTVNDSARALMAVVAKWRDDNNGSLTTAGTATAYTLTTNTVFTTLALMANQTLAFTMSATSGATPTLNVDSLGAKVIRTATGATLPTGALLSGSIYRATYSNVSGEWLLHNQAAVLPASIVATANIADSAVTYAKIQNVSATSRLLGRSTAGAGAVEEISLASGLSIVAGALTPGISAVLIPNYLSGLTLSTAGSSATMSIAAGVANDSTNTVLMSLAAIGKTTASWAVGTGNGGLDTLSIANSTWYHFYVIERVDTGVVDVVFSTSASAPTLPTNYTIYRRIGSGKTNGSGQWTLFTQTHDTFIWDTAITDANSIALNVGSRALRTLTVPTGIAVKALYRAGLNTVTGTATVALTSPQESDQAPSSVFADLASVTSGLTNGSFSTLTNTSAQIGQRGNATNGVLTISTYGWIDTRGK